MVFGVARFKRFALSSPTVDSGLHVLLGVTLTLLVHGALWVGAASVAAVWPAALGVADRLLVAFSLAVFQVVGLTLAAAALGLLKAEVLGFASVTLSVVAVIATCRLRRAGILALFEFGGPRELVLAVWVRLRSIASSDPMVFLVLAPGAAFFALLYLYALPRPPMGFDPLNYHLTIAATAIQTGTFPIVFFPPYFDLYAWFPANGTIFSIWTMLWMGCDLGLALVNLPFLAAMGLALYLLARGLGVGRTTSAAVASALSTVPMMAMLATEAYVEVPMWALFFVALRFATKSGPGSGSGLFGLTAGLCGVLTGVKSNALLLVVLILLIHLAPASRLDRAFLRGLLRRIGLLLFAMVIFGSYFYIRNYLLSGNPVYPYPVKVFGVEVFPGQPDRDSRLFAASIAANFDYLWESGKLLKAIVGDVWTPFASWGLGPTGLASLLLGATAGLWSAIGSRNRVASAFLLAGLVNLAAWFVMPYGGNFLFYNVRFAYPSVALLGLLAAHALERAWPNRPALLWAILVCQVLTFFFTNISITAGLGWTLACVAAVAGVGGLCTRAPALRTWMTARLTRSRSRQCLLVGVLAGLAVYLIAHWHDVSERDRIASYREATEPYRLQVSVFADCLAAVERHLPRGRLAVALEPYRRGFLSPLFGSHLQREVFYVHNGPESSRLHSDYPYGNPRLAPDEGSWLRHLAQASADALLVYLDANENVVPIESQWAASRPERFRLLYRSEWCELYRIDRSQPGAYD